MATKTKTKKRAPEMTTFTTKKGAVYKVPAEFKDSTNLSDILRALSGRGMSTAEIAKMTDVRYQHVRNVLTAQPKKTA